MAVVSDTTATRSQGLALGGGNMWKLVILGALAWIVIAFIGRQMETEAKRASDNYR